MKKLFKILAWICAVLVALLLALEFSLDPIVLKTFNAAAPSALGVPATLENAQFSLARGKASLRGLHIGNPKGFNTDGLLDLASISVRLDNASLLTDTIVIREIAIDGLVVTYEKGLLNSNLGALIDQLSAGQTPAEKEEAEQKEAEQKAKSAEEKPAKKVVIEKLTITGSRMNFSVTGAMGAALPLPLPPITLTNLGKEKDGLTVVEAIQEILNAIAGAAGTAIAGSAQLLGQGVEALGDGAKAVGEAGLEAGKAIGNAAGDAGKAVGDALKTINPFK